MAVQKLAIGTPNQVKTVSDIPAEVLVHHVFRSLLFPDLIVCSMVCSTWRKFCAKLLSNISLGTEENGDPRRAKAILLLRLSFSNNIPSTQLAWFTKSLGFPQIERPAQSASFSIFLVGDARVGKSALVRKFILNEFEEDCPRSVW